MIMDKDAKNLLEGYEKSTRSDFKVHKTAGSPGTTLNKSYLEEKII